MAAKRPKILPVVPAESWLTCFNEEFVYNIADKGNGRLTRGAFGDISVAVYRQHDRPRLIAVKSLTQTIAPVPWGSEERTLAQEVFHEVSALRLLSPHANIVTLLAMYPAKERAYAGTSLSLAFEFCPVDLQLSLDWRRRNFLPLLSLETVRTVARDVLCALQHCHSNGVLHCDLKPGNLLVSSAGYIQLCDFGLAKPGVNLDLHGSSASQLSQPVDGQVSRGMCTRYYRPPEILLGGAADHPSVDMWSAGTVVAELLLNRPLFCGATDLDQSNRIFDCLGTPSDSNWPDATDLPDFGKLHYFLEKEPRAWRQILPRVVESNHLEDFLRGMLALDPAKRRTSADIFQHAWLQQNSVAPRGVLQRDLIPDALQEPVLLSSTDPDYTVATQQALAAAATRRTFFTGLDKQHWKK